MRRRRALFCWQPFWPPPPRPGARRTTCGRTAARTSSAAARPTPPTPGSGGGQPCAWSHPFYALTGGGAWKLVGGDTLVMGPGAYRMGYGAPNTGWCDAGGAWDCHLPPLPSGGATTPTRLLGKGWDSGCASAPQLWGAERADSVLDLSGTANALVACLDDHGPRRLRGVPQPRRPWPASATAPPYGDWARRGPLRRRLRGLSRCATSTMHGLAAQGRARRPAVAIGRWRTCASPATAAAGWDGDLGEGQRRNTRHPHLPAARPSSGTAASKHGRAASRPAAGPRRPGATATASAPARRGGQLDHRGLPLPATTPPTGWTCSTWAWVARRAPRSACGARWRTGNAGNQLKLADTADGEQLAGGGQLRLLRRPALRHSDGRIRSLPRARCLAGVEPPRRDSASLVNSTVVGQGDCLLLVECETANCTGSETALIQNNVLRGYVDWRQPWENACLVCRTPPASPPAGSTGTRSTTSRTTRGAAPRARTTPATWSRSSSTSPWARPSTGTCRPAAPPSTPACRWARWAGWCPRATSRASPGPRAPASIAGPTSDPARSAPCPRATSAATAGPTCCGATWPATATCSGS